MAKKQTPTRPGQIQPQWTKEICDDCNHGNWVDSFSNMDWENKPICLMCPFKQFHILRGSKACANWKPKPKEGEQ